MGREIRRVPKNWEHPKTFNGKFKPLYDGYVSHLEYYKESVDEFILYMTEIIEKGKVKIYKEVFTDVKKLYEYLTEDGQMNPKDINDYMPTGEWYQLFETVSEGTPLSPPFETKKELVDWLSDNLDFWGHQWTRSKAEAMLEIGFSPSGALCNGVFYKSEEIPEIFKRSEVSK